MKRLLLIVLIAMLGLAALPASAEMSWCAPEQVDLSQVKEENGRLIGEILISESDGRPHLLRIDCPVPAKFTEEQQAKLHVSYRVISKKELAAAMKALGQKVSADDMGQYRGGWATRCLWYKNGGGEVNGDGLSYPRVMPGYRNEERLTEVAQAVDKLKALAEELSIPLDWQSLSAVRSTPQDFLRFYSPTERDSGWYQREFQRLADTLGTDDITLMEAGYRLYDLPVLRQFAWKEQGDVHGETSAMECAVGDNGTILDLNIYGVPVVESAEPITLPAMDWQELLRQFVSQCYWPNWASEDEQHTETICPEPYTVFAGYDIITSIEPCWVGQEKQCLEPGWNVTYISHVMKDDSIRSWQQKCLRAIDLSKAW